MLCYRIDISSIYLSTAYKTGCIYQGEPRAEYGKMDIVSSPISESMKNVELDLSGRKEMWGKPGRDATRNLSVDVSTSPPPKKFSDILPAELITSPSSAKSNTSMSFSPNSPKGSSDRLRRAARSSALPKMQGVVKSLMETVRTRTKRSEEDTRSMMSKGLLADDAESIVSDTGSKF